jgi:hypothetical protein
MGKNPLRAFKSSSIKRHHLIALAVLVLAGAASFSNIFPTGQVQAANVDAPTVNIQYGDAQSSGPTLPAQCGNQLGAAGTSTSDNDNPDCLRVSITNPNDTFTKDFRFCLFYNGQQSCSPWASESQGYIAYNNFVSGNSGGHLAGTMYASVQTRAVTAANPPLPVGTTFTDVSAGVGLAYQNNYGPCTSSSGVVESPAGSTGWSAWAYGAQRDDDPGCFRAGLRVGSINIPPDADYVSTTIPTSALTSSTAFNGNYRIKFENRGVQWAADKQIRPLDGHCNDAAAGGPFDYSGGAICHDYVISSSDRYRLKRVDDTPVGVRSQRFTTGSNQITYNGSTYTFTGQETTIPILTGLGGGANVTTSNTIPFFIRQDVTFQKVTYIDEICEPGGSGFAPQKNQSMFADLAHKILGNLIPTAYALDDIDNEPGDVCHPVPSSYIQQTKNPWTPNIQFSQQIEFAPVNITTPATGGTYNLEFTMVDLTNKSESTFPFNNNGQFGEVGSIPVVVSGAVTPLDATMAATSPVQMGSSTQLTWTSQNAESCKQFVMQPRGIEFTELTGGTYGTTNGQSTYTIDLLGTYTFMNQCYNSTLIPNTVSALAYVDVEETNLQATITATPSIQNGQNSHVVWDSPDPAPGTTCEQYYADSKGTTTAISYTLSGSQDVGPLSGPATFTFYNHCHNDTPIPPDVTASAETQVSAPEVLDCALSANPASPIAYNSSTLVSWSAPNAQAVQMFREESYGNGTWLSINGANTISGSYFTPHLTDDTRYLCQAISPNTTPTQVDVIIDIQVSAPLPLDATLSVVSPVNVGQTTTLTWNSSNADSCSVYREQTYGAADWIEISGANTLSGSQPYGPFGSAGSYRFMNVCTGSGTSPSIAYSPIRTVVVNNITPPNPPATISIDVSVCEQATINWTAPNGGPAPTGYNIYRSTDGTVWQLIAPPSPVNNATFSYTDHPPLGNYYYAVTALNGAAESTKRSAGPAAVHPCEPNLANSDKDITAVSPVGIDTKFTNIESCNAVSDPVVLNGGKSFKVDDIVTFQINICNTGDEAALGVTVPDTLSNLSAPDNFSFEGCSQGEALLDKNGALTFSVGDVGPHSTCSISFTARVTKPASGTIYRFQNIGDITPTNWPVRRVVTPAYLFTDSTGNPDRNEIAP